jgi:general stress protein YciG
MPKPVQKPRKKSTAKRPSADPNRRAHQLMEQHMALTADETVTPPHGDPFEAMFKARMAELGRKGGKASGAKRMEMPEKKRKALASNAARARWAGKPTKG